MKVYSCPDEVPFPEPDYDNYDTSKEIAREKKHTQDLKNWMLHIARPKAGPYTGEVLRIPVADGYARYMLCDLPRGSFLVHLPYGDKYDSHDAEFLPKKEVINRIEHDKRLREIFSRQGIGA